MAKKPPSKNTARANKRLARIRLRNPKSLAGIRKEGYTPRERQKIKQVDARQRAGDAKKKQAKQRTAAAKKYDPLAPLTGEREKLEMASAERLQFGDQDRELARSQRGQAQTTANVGTYYDDWKRALGEASARVNAANSAAVTAQEGRVDSAFTQDNARIAASNAEASKTAATLGRGPVTSEEGTRAVEAQRSQGNQGVGRLREGAAADVTLGASREATSVQAKAEALSREHGKSDTLRREVEAQAGKKGDFRVSYRSKAREGERQWAAVQEEFGIKREDIAGKNKSSAADRSVEKMKANAQKTIARLYTSGNKAKARAQIRVAELQLKKGEISKSQFKTIKNIYEGLPGKGGSGGKGGSPPKGRGPGGTLAPDQRDAVDTGYESLKGAKPNASQRSSMIRKMIDRGKLSPREARMAWQRYERNFLRGPSRSQTHGPNRPN